MYEWRKMTDEERKQMISIRLEGRKRWHRPSEFEWDKWFHVTAACYEHRPFIGASTQRMKEVSKDLLLFFEKHHLEVAAWVLLPNHYHLLLKIHVLPLVKKSVGQLHGRLSHQWNIEDGLQGRKCFHGSLFKPIRSEAHKWSTLNYIHHNPVKHGYVDNWADWPFGSARIYLQRTPRKQVIAAWEAFPINGMGDNWDED